MKKIININLSGRVIPIEDSAYEKLQAYIESLRRYFANEDGRDEIINDIESRIAELMSDKVRKGAACVTDSDINEIIASMGTPEDFDADATEPTRPSQASAKPDYTQQERQERRAKSRLYRDANDKFIGGVCSGLAAYMNVDPAIVRILFAIITFGGFGLGFLIYLLLWMILPPKDLEGYRGKRLYRNPEDRMIGGVAGGLAAYLDKEPRVIRLIFAAPFLLSLVISILKGFTWDFDHHIFSNLVFGSISSTFALVYIILWMVLPEANSAYEKMEMRGEKVDVNSIRQNVREGMDNMKDRVKGWSDEVKESAQNFSTRAKDFANTRGKAFASEVGETARRGGGGIGHVIGVLFKAFFFFVFGTIAFSLIVALIGLLFGGIAWWPFNNFLWTSKWQQAYGWGTIIFFIFIPLLAFIIWLIRRILRVKSRHSYLGWTFGFLWTIGWISAALLAASVTRDFKRKAGVTIPVTLSQPRLDRMTVIVSQPEIEYNGSFSWLNDHRDRAAGWDISEDTLKMSFVEFSFLRSTDAEYHVNMIKYSCGYNTEDARNRASKIDYNVSSRDSLLDIGSGFAIDRSSKYRLQHVQVQIYIPVGKKIRFDNTVREKLHGLDINWNGDGDNDWPHTDHYEHESFYFRSNTDYIMTENGDLKDTNVSTPVNETSPEKKVKSGSDYRYNDGDNKNADSAKSNKEVKPVTATPSQTSTDDVNGLDDNAHALAVVTPRSGMKLIAWF